MKRVFAVSALLLILCVALAYAQYTPATGSDSKPSANVQRCVYQPTTLRLTAPALSLMVAPPSVQVILKNQDKLQLSDEQKTKVSELLTDAGKTRRALLDKLVKSAGELKPALLDDKFDLDRVQQLAEAARKAEADLMNADIETWSKLREILTNNQVKQLREIMMPTQEKGLKPRVIIPREVIPQSPEDLNSADKSK